MQFKSSDTLNHVNQRTWMRVRVSVKFALLFIALNIFVPL
jgi:hypothetical protein